MGGSVGVRARVGVRVRVIEMELAVLVDHREHSVSVLVDL